MSFDVACEEVGDTSQDLAAEEVGDTSQDFQVDDANQEEGTDLAATDGSEVSLPDEVHIKKESDCQEDEEEDDIDCENNQEDEKPNASLLHSLLLKVGY